MDEPKKNTKEIEIELDKQSIKEIQLEVKYPEFFETNRQQNLENFQSSNNNDNNDDIIIVQDDSNDAENKDQPKMDKKQENIHIPIEPNYDNINFPPREINYPSLPVKLNNNVSKPEFKQSSSKNQAQKFFFEDIYKDVLFFFINPIAGSNDGQLLIDMGVKKVEFLDNMKSSASSAYIFNIIDESSYIQGIALLKDYQERGKFNINLVPRSLPKVIIGGGDGTLLKVIEKLMEEKINVHNCVFGILPLGNNNTLSQALGWGGSLNLKKIIFESAQICRNLK
jgi:hypothetical protein